MLQGDGRAQRYGAAVKRTLVLAAFLLLPCCKSPKSPPLRLPPSTGPAYGEKEGTWEAKENWRKQLVKGMPKGRVREILGVPDRVDVLGPLGEQWHYPSGGAVSITQAGYLLGWIEPSIFSAAERGPQDAGWRLRENWRARLRKGLTRDQVRALMGEPEKIDMNGPIETWWYGWPSGGDILFSPPNMEVSAWGEPPPHLVR